MGRGTASFGCSRSLPEGCESSASGFSERFSKNGNAALRYCEAPLVVGVARDEALAAFPKRECVPARPVGEERDSSSCKFLKGGNAPARYCAALLVAGVARAQALAALPKRECVPARPQGEERGQERDSRNCKLRCRSEVRQCSFEALGKGARRSEPSSPSQNTHGTARPKPSYLLVKERAVEPVPKHSYRAR